MTLQVLAPRRRKKVKKSYRSRCTTGCRTCRIRRIKCDETNPSCKNCLRGRRVCDGYLHSSPNEQEMLQVSSVTLSLSASLLKTTQEKRSFDFFQRRTIPQLAGCFQSHFWERLLLQAIQHEPAVQHAAVALGAFHERFEICPNVTEEDQEFALQQYVQAIRLLTMPMREKDRQAADVALLTCVLFICFEILRGYHGAALSHIDGGVRIVSELQSCPSSEGPLSLPNNPYVPLPVLNQIFSLLDTQASQIAFNRRRQLFFEDLSSNDPVDALRIPVAFHSLEAASDGLDYIRTHATRMAESLPQPPLSNPSLAPDDVKLSLVLVHNFSVISLRQWSSAFQSYLEYQHEFTEAEQIALKLLRLHRVQLELTLTIDYGRMGDEMIWDQHVSKFEVIVSLAEEFLRSRPTKDSRPVFTLDYEVVMPLFYAAVKCRDSTLRWTAIALLRSSHRQEGIWNSLSAADVVERLVRIEEDGLHGTITAASIPLQKRVLGVEIKFDAIRRRAKLRYIKATEDGGREDIDEWFEAREAPLSKSEPRSTIQGGIRTISINAE